MATSDNEWDWSDDSTNSSGGMTDSQKFWDAQKAEAKRRAEAPSTLETILNTIKSVGSHDYGADIKTITQPGMMQDLWKYTKEKMTSYPNGAPADESTPTLDLLLNTIHNSMKVATSVIDPENPAGSIAMAPISGLEDVGRAAQEATEAFEPISQSAKLAEAAKVPGKVQAGRFVGQSLEATPGVTMRRAQQAAEEATAGGPGIGRPGSTQPPPPPSSPAVSRVKQFLDSSTDGRELTEADKAKAIIRSETGASEMGRFQEVGHDQWTNVKTSVTGKTPLQEFNEQHDLAKQMASWYKRSPQEGIDMIRRIEQTPSTVGEFRALNPQDEEMAKVLSDANLERQSKIDALSEADGASYNESYARYYMSHLFNDPDKATQLFDQEIANLRIARGKNFEMPDSGKLLDTALESGLKLKTSNPIEFSLSKSADMDRFILAHNIKNAMVDNGLAIEHGTDTIPPNWIKLENAPLGNKTYFAQPDAAAIFNRHFAPGLGGNVAYQVLKGMNNDLTMAQLGFSGFHALFESMNSTISDMAYAGEQFSRCNLGEAGKAAARSLSVIGSPIQDALVGGRMMQEALHPGAFSQYAAEVKAVAQAGGRVSVDPIYYTRAIDSFRQAVQNGNYPKAIAKAIPALFEGTSKPLMEWYVPRIKLGAFQKMAAQTLEDAKKLGWSELQTHTALQSAWDSIDNRFGQLVYNNLFWNKSTKDLAMLAMRAPGWNIGTIRELGGGVMDLAKQSGRLFAEGQFQLSHRMAYTLAMPLMTGYVGGLWHYFMTGKVPQSPRDYFYPADGTKDINGNDNRVNFPSYAKDVMGLANHPLKTALGKAAPALTMAADLIQNKDFYSTQIWKPGAGMPVDIAKYLADQLTPFSLRNYKKRALSEGGDSLGSLIQSITGILPAPREFVKTPAENLATDFMADKFGSQTISQEERARRDMKTSIESSFRRGAIGVGDLVKAVGSGKITSRQMQDIIQYRNLPLLARNIKQLTPDQAFQVFQKANPKERPLIMKEVRAQLLNGMRKAESIKEKQTWARRLTNLAGPVAGDDDMEAPQY